MGVLVVVSHDVDEQEEAVSLQSSVFVVVQGPRLQDLSDHVVDHLNFRVIDDDLMHETHVLGGDVLLVGKKELHFEAAVFSVQDQLYHG